MHKYVYVYKLSGWRVEVPASSKGELECPGELITRRKYVTTPGYDTQ